MTTQRWDDPASDTPARRAERLAALPPAERDKFADLYFDMGRIWCRADGEWHRPPECPIDQNGQPVPVWGDLSDTTAGEVTEAVPRFVDETPADYQEPDVAAHPDNCPECGCSWDDHDGGGFCSGPCHGNRCHGRQFLRRVTDGAGDSQ